MPETFQLEIVTPTAVIDCGAVKYLRAPSEDGLFGVMAHHARAIVSLKVGEIKFVQNGKTHYYATNGGYADIHGNNVQLLVETAEPADAINRDRASQAAERAKERVHDRTPDVDHARAEAALQRAVNRLSVAGRRG